MTEHPAGLSPDEWQRAKELFNDALERPPADRAAYLDQACRTEDAAVRREIESLLAAHHASESFLEAPPDRGTRLGKTRTSAG